MNTVLYYNTNMIKGICSFPECERPHKSKGYCQKHYFRLWKHGDVNIILPYGGIKFRKQCTIEGCEKLNVSKGLCGMHTYRRNTRGDAGGPKPEREKLGDLYYSPTYRSWVNMKSRCYGNRAEDKRLYQNRGIGVCDEWRKSFLAFYRDMGERPEGMSIDRINNDKGYEPSNCRWATQSQQNSNRRKYIKISGR